jgi:uncharacterized protein (DUF983 family)
MIDRKATADNRSLALSHRAAVPMPRRGKGKLFGGFLTLKNDCDSCDLDFNFADWGDGPAIFVIMIAGAIVVGAALITEVSISLRSGFTPLCGFL